MAVAREYNRHYGGHGLAASNYETYVQFIIQQTQPQTHFPSDALPRYQELINHMFDLSRITSTLYPSRITIESIPWYAEAFDNEDKICSLLYLVPFYLLPLNTKVLYGIQNAVKDGMLVCISTKTLLCMWHELFSMYVKFPQIISII